MSIIALTGATRGLGRALVHEFAAAGHTVFGCGRSETHVAELAREYGEPHAFRVVDVTREADVEAWAAEVLTVRAPDLVINNAALINANAPLWRVPADEFERVITTNLIGTASVIRHFVPALIARGEGIVVNLSSGWGRSTSPEVAPYCATKWGVEGLTQALAQELPPGVATVALSPGVVRTEMLDSCMGAAAAAYEDPGTWATRAAPFLLQLTAANNGEALTVP